MLKGIDVSRYRKPEFDVDEIFLNRWSPRAMSGEEISEAELMSLFEAAKWAPSSFNNQPWRFLYTRRDSENWGLFFNLLAEFNQAWAKNASALIVIISRKTFDHNGKPSRTHSFDAGAAWQNLALQGALKALVVHGMQGLDYDKAREVLNVSDDYEVEAMATVGMRVKVEELPEKLREREFPSTKKRLSEIVFEGKLR